MAGCVKSIWYFFAEDKKIFHFILLAIVFSYDLCHHLLSAKWLIFSAYKTESLYFYFYLAFILLHTL